MPDVKNEQYYLEHQDEFDALSEEQRTALLTTGFGASEGDTPAENDDPEPQGDEQAIEPAAEEVDATPDVEAEGSDKEPVVLAKDGKHTIPFAELEEARERARYWEERALEKPAQQAEPSPKPETPEPEPRPDVKSLRRQAQDALLAGDEDLAHDLATKADDEVLRLAEERVLKMLEPFQKREQDNAETLHFKTIADAHPDYESVVSSDAMQAWMQTQPSFLQAAYQNVLERGTASQVVELLDLYTGQQEKPPPAVVPDDKATISRKAEEAIANAKPKVPTSLSELPSGSRTPHDETEAIRNMDGVNLMNKFAGKSPDQIMELMSRVI